MRSHIVLCIDSFILQCTVSGAGAWAGAPGGPEAGDGGGHEAAGEGHAWEAGHTGSAAASARPSQDSQPANVPQSTGRCTRTHHNVLLHSPADKTHINTALVALEDSEREAEKKQAKAEQLEKKMEEMEKVMMEMEQRCV